MRYLAFTIALSACGPDIHLTDDIDLTWDFELTVKRFDGDLHTPYVKGAPVTLFVSGGDDDDLTGWKIYSTDSSVFAIDGYTLDEKGHSITATGRALTEGIAGLVIEDHHGKSVGVDEAEVVAPDRVELDAHGYLIMDREPEALVDELRIVAGGEATYLVRYFRGNRMLHGNSVLSIDPTTTGLAARARTSFLFENREWISVQSTTTPGTQSISMRADGTPVGSIPVVTVPETDIADVALINQSERNHEDGDWLVLLAQSYDGVQRKIFGVDYAWEIDGVMQTEAGDLYRYYFEKGDYKTVTAERSGHAATTTIQSDHGFVDSTNRIGCNAGGGGAGALSALGLLGLLGLRRRRA